MFRFAPFADIRRPRIYLRRATWQLLFLCVVHGAWHGGWCWGPLERALRGCGHDVTSPTLTGLGERSHLASPNIVPDTHVLDIVNHIKWKDLEDVILVGHSYADVIITGVVGWVPGRIRTLVYL